MHENTKKIILLSVAFGVPSPLPHAKVTKINEMHEKGDGGGGKLLELFN